MQEQHPRSIILSSDALHQDASSGRKESFGTAMTVRELILPILGDEYAELDVIEPIGRTAHTLNYERTPPMR